MCNLRHLTALCLLGAALLFPAGAILALEQPELRELERLLRDLGFDPGPVDGVVDEATIEGVRRYQSFALLPGPPEPDERLLDELRGVAAAFAALSDGRAEQPTAVETEPPERDGAEPGVAEPESGVAEKTLVPPPAPPAKLMPDRSPAEDRAAAEEEPEEPAQAAEMPPAEASDGASVEPEVFEAKPNDDAALPPDVVLDPALLNDPDVYGPGSYDPGEEASDPAAAREAGIAAELQPFRRQLGDGSLTRAELAKQFNQEGRALLQTARYEEAILKFSVAIHLDPEFAGAYSNRGTAYERQEERDLALQDFEKARELGFGGLRIRDGRNPLN